MGLKKLDSESKLERALDQIKNGYILEAEQSLTELGIDNLSPKTSLRRCGALAYLNAITGRRSEALDLSNHVLTSTEVSSEANFNALLSVAISGETELLRSYIKRIKSLPLDKIHYFQGLTNLAANQLRDAEACFSKVTGSDVSLGTLRAEAEARLYLLQGQTERAVAVLQENFNKKRGNVSALVSLLGILLMLQRWNEALDFIRAEYPTEETPPLVSLSLADIYFRADRFQEAAIHALNVLLSDPWNPRAAYIYAGASYKLGDSEPAELFLEELLDDTDFGFVSWQLLLAVYARRWRFGKYWRLVVIGSQRGWLKRGDSHRQK